MRYLPNTICRLAVALVFFQPAGCATTDIIPERPFAGSEQAIQVGQTRRSEIRSLLGIPYDRDPEGDWEVYQARTDGVRLVLIVPYSKMNMWTHYLFITYDADDRVTHVGTGSDKTDSTRPSGQRLTIYAGHYGYHTGTGMAFPSVDGGGEADSSWADYLTNTEHVEVHHRFRGYGDALRSLCRAAEQGHPCANRELGNLFWGGRAESYAFHERGARYCRSPSLDGRGPYMARDSVYACVWYSLAGDGGLRPWCREVLSAAEIARVERLLAYRRPGWCEQQLAPYICGADACR